MRGRLTAGVLAALLGLPGCGAEPPVSPLPIEPAVSTAPPPSPAAPVVSAVPVTTPATSSPPPAARPTRTRTTGPPRPVRTTATAPAPELPACRGAVVVTIDLTRDELALVPALCVAVGAQLRIENIGPGLVTTDDEDLVDQRYEAGVVQIRLVRPGTVVVTIPQDEQAYDVTVVIR